MNDSVKRVPLDDASHDILVTELCLQNTFISVRCLLPSTPESLERIEERLDSGEDVEGGREGRAGLEVTDPELCSRELPFPATRISEFFILVQLEEYHHASVGGVEADVSPNITIISGSCLRDIY